MQTALIPVVLFQPVKSAVAPALERLGTGYEGKDIGSHNMKDLR